MIEFNGIRIDEGPELEAGSGIEISDTSDGKKKISLSGGGGTGVSSFNGRTGAVTPQSGDYTAEMVGAIPSVDVTSIAAVTQTEYDALTAKNATTLYVIKE